MDSCLLAGFPFLYVPLSISCCCVYFSSLTSAVGPGDVRLWAEAFCDSFLGQMGHEAFQKKGDTFFDVLGDNVSCGSSTIASVVISTPDDCVSSLERGVTSRLSFALQNQEAFAVPVSINGEEHNFYAKKGANHTFWANRFCRYNGIGGEDCVRGVVENGILYPKV
ncbi:hypothetical protein TrCOL_g1736 [Triparma columacea]|uniref:Uncharacterized protein n=1 Tax=Triparma columacea TaxID=722753 RepID=A0A9W7L782_9STRA|nr:hypothetical protein TrCOL_g1736 [Triparma columacea]